MARAWLGRMVLLRDQMRAPSCLSTCSKLGGQSIYVITEWRKVLVSVALSVRRVELHSMEAREHYALAISHSVVGQSLPNANSLWGMENPLPLPRRKITPPIEWNPPASPIPLTQCLVTLTVKWVQYSKVVSHSASTALTRAQVQRKHSEAGKRDEHRSFKLKLRKLKNILLLCW